MKIPYLLYPILFTGSILAQGPEFKMQTIDDKVGIGYGVQLADMNADGKVDILLVDKDKVAWYENPSWKKRIIVDHLTKIPGIKNIRSSFALKQVLYSTALPLG